VYPALFYTYNRGRAMEEAGRPKRPGAEEQVLTIDVSFEEAIRRIATKQVPPEGLPPAQVRERRWKKKPAE
jgi:hypothetical protein